LIPAGCVLTGISSFRYSIKPFYLLHEFNLSI